MANVKIFLSVQVANVTRAGCEKASTGQFELLRCLLCLYFDICVEYLYFYICVQYLCFDICESTFPSWYSVQCSIGKVVFVSINVCICTGTYLFELAHICICTGTYLYLYWHIMYFYLPRVLGQGSFGKVFLVRKVQVRSCLSFKSFKKPWQPDILQEHKHQFFKFKFNFARFTGQVKSLGNLICYRSTNTNFSNLNSTLPGSLVK